MARGAMTIGLAVAIVAALCTPASAQMPGCTTAIISLTPCLGYITGNSSTPSAPCCSQLATVVQTQAQCLCALLNGGGAASIGLNINQTQALTLPGACKVQTPPLSQCNAAAGGPATAPVGTPSTPSVPSNPTPETPTTPSVPSGSSPATPTTPSVPSGGSKTVPSTTSDGRSNKSSRSMTFAILFLVACVSSITNL